ncbi:VWA domain-containing protein [Acidithiobacillus ferriphilus]|uniref:VWA domain-containing protein n=1 Tax=Acidithiobacillus ferriphilus TaxID=1689834 RepID=UPI002DB5780F|nr:VWA domain-containing protein [Acidithiobacillus ferriphilus]MEB8474670.1 VWA domain-containing protein [Acidithiobacillus ferriphilus]
MDMKKVISAFSTGLASTGSKVDVVFAGSAGSLPNVIYLPKSLLKADAHEVRTALAYAIHETGHHRYSDFATYHGITDENVRHLWNIIEDARVESMIIQDYPGTRNYLEYTIIPFVIGNCVNALNRWKAGKKDDLLLVRAVVMAQSRRMVYPELLKEISDVVSTEGAIAYGEALIENVCQIIESEKSPLEKASEIIDVLRDLEKPPCSPSGGDSQGEEGEGDDAESGQPTGEDQEGEASDEQQDQNQPSGGDSHGEEGEGDDAESGQPTGEDQEGEASDEQQDQNQPSGGDSHGEEGEGDDAESGQPTGEDQEGEASDEQQDQNQPSGGDSHGEEGEGDDAESGQPTGEDQEGEASDEQQDQNQPSGGESQGEERDGDVAGSSQPTEYGQEGGANNTPAPEFDFGASLSSILWGGSSAGEEAIDEWSQLPVIIKIAESSNIRVVPNKSLSRLAENLTEAFTRKGGKVKKGKGHSLITSRLPIARSGLNVFGAKSYLAESSAHFVLVVDVSGSMHGQVQEAMTTALTLAKAMEDAGDVRIDVIAYQTECIWNADTSTITEKNVIITHIEDKKRLPTCAAAGTTPTAEAIIHSVSMLNGSPYYRKGICVITDGVPNLPHMDLCDRVEKQGIEIYGIGIGDGGAEAVKSNFRKQIFTTMDNLGDGVCKAISA